MYKCHKSSSAMNDVGNSNGNLTSLMTQKVSDNGVDDGVEKHMMETLIR